MKLISRLVLISTFLFGAIGCDGGPDEFVDESTESITTHFGDSVATTERTNTGDISTWLTSPDSTALLGELSFIADTGDFFGQVMAEEVPFDGVMELSSASLDQLNILLHTLWEIERDDPPGVYCTQNDFAICCRDDGWSCQAF